MKAKRPAKTALPITIPEAPTALVIPEELKCLTNSPTQVFSEIFAKALADPATRPVVAGFLSGLGIDFGVPVPEWVKRASMKLVESCGLSFLLHNSADLITHEEIGKIVALWEKMPKGNDEPTRITKALDFFCALMKRLSCDEPPAAARNFHDGRVKAEQIDYKASNPSNRTKIFIQIVLKWPEIAQLKSTAEFWQWLLAQTEADGKKAIAPGTDSREVRAVCKIIGLRYPNRGGRPRKKN